MIAVAKNAQLKAQLATWFARQSRFANLRDMAKAVEIPFNTLRGYFSGKTPSGANITRLSDATGIDIGALRGQEAARNTTRVGLGDQSVAYTIRLLEDLQFEMARCMSGIPPAQEALYEHVKGVRIGLSRKAQTVQVLMDALQRNLAPMLADQAALRALRQKVSGSDAGYLSGLFGALFDDQRLATWRDMTTYRYGSK
jgi:hypothetical protein